MAKRCLTPQPVLQGSRYSTVTLALLLPIVFVLGAFAASLGNAAIYGWAWNSRRVSPWQLPAEGVQRRTWLDCVPIIGWLRLRRDEPVLGKRFWLRPMLLELLFAAYATYFAFHVLFVGSVIEPQLLDLQRFVGVAVDLPAFGALDLTRLAWDLLPHLVLQLVLLWLMFVASVIDCDEKTIPDEVTVPGTLLGLVLVTLLPMGHLPNVEVRQAPPIVGAELLRDGEPIATDLGETLWIEPTHVAAPLDWPGELAGGPANGTALGVGLACYGLWCFALTPRYLRLRRGLLFGVSVVLRRVVRSLRTRPLREITLGGVLWITSVWYTGGAAWQGLLTGLVGLVVAGGIVWAVRIIGSTALGREAMGFGDVTLMMMVGVYVGWQAGLLAFFLAPFAGLLVGVLQLVLRRDDEIPYGPFLCLATAGLVSQWGRFWPGVEGVFSLTWIVLVVLVVCLVMLGVLLGVWRVIKERLLGMGDA
ncbi:MAG: A24 family peptidase [Planctomycetota bacterium]